MRLLLLAAAGGAIGSALRHLVNMAGLKLLGPGFPWWTLFVNVVGSFIMGLVVVLIALRANAATEIRTFVATGMLGGFTTFSAFSLDFAALIERREIAGASSYLVLNVGLSITAVFAGLWLARWLSSSL
ncbi:MAG: fluoride efflux transporter CrcB [Hyphomicrobiaceae bacterium]